MTSKQMDAIEHAARLLGCDPAELKGETMRSLFHDIEENYPEAVVYWGCWTDAELDAVI